MTSSAHTSEAGSFAALVEEHYRLRVRTIDSIVSAEEKRVWRVGGDAGEAIIVRAYARHDALAVVRAQAALLTALAAHRFPAERLILTRTHAPSVSVAGWTLLATTAIAGEPTGHTAEAFHALGARLGQLHALDPAAVLGEGHAVGAAAMLPAREIAWVMGELARVATRLAGTQRAQYAWLAAALAALDRCDDLPNVLIHNDCHPGNALTTPRGEIVLVDWEGAGLGPAIIDLGFLLASCVTEAPWKPPLPPEPARIEALVAGYRRHRQPTEVELGRLADAIRFRALIYGAADFARRSGEATTADNLWWRARYDAAAPLARRVRELCSARMAQG